MPVHRSSDCSTPLAGKITLTAVSVYESSPAGMAKTQVKAVGQTRTTTVMIQGNSFQKVPLFYKITQTSKQRWCGIKFFKERSAARMQ